MKIEFADGESFDTSGAYRIEHRSDGYYVIGRGFLCPVDSREEGEEMIAKFKKEEE